MYIVRVHILLYYIEIVILKTKKISLNPIKLNVINLFIMIVNVDNLVFYFNYNIML